MGVLLSERMRRPKGRPHPDRLWEEPKEDGTMRVTLDIPDFVFRRPKTPEQVSQDIRQAAVMYWLARGDITVPDLIQASGGDLVPPKDFKSFLLSMPDVGDDSIFERAVQSGREVDLCDT
jgi:hypothetical protein